MQLARRRPWRTFLVAALVGFLILNGLAWMHARAMTHFVPGARHVPLPEDMTLGQKAVALVLGVRVPRPTNTLSPRDYRLPFQTITLTASDGVTLEAWSIPGASAEAVWILVHGYADCKCMLLPEAAALHDLGYGCLLVDLRGSGGSEGNVTYMGYREAADVAAAAQWMADTSPQARLCLFGRSMGAAAILRAVALGQVEPAGLFLECPFDRLLTTVQNRFHLVGAPAFPAAQLLVFWGGRQLGFDAFQHNPVEYARSVDCPTVVLEGGQDRRVSLREAENLRDALGGHGRLLVFQRTGHLGFLQDEPERWRQAARDLAEGPAP